MGMNDRIKNFSPAWFASVMGTGILAMTSYYYASFIPMLKEFSYLLVSFNIALFMVLFIPWTSRWIWFREEAMADLEHPVNSNFYITMPISIVVIAANLSIVSHDIEIIETLWLLGSFLVIIFSILTPYIMFKGAHVKLEHISPAWFIPPVALIIIPMVGSSYIHHFSGLMQEFIIFLNYFSWGAGFFIFLALFSICLYRFILHHPMPNVMAPTIWIGLGPIGAGSVALINLIKNSDFVSVKEPFFVFTFLFWGLGIWWFMIAIAMTIHYIKNLKLPYAVSWWAFIFPLGAYVAASHSISMALNMQFINYIGFALYWLLLFLWVVTSVKTLFHVFGGEK